MLVGALEEHYEHSAYEVVDLDALGQGQQVLRAQGWRHLWGIGRHLLGSQLFDYWFDPDGFEYEHYTDGDLFTADVETCYSPLEFGSLWAWGADAPASMKPTMNLRTLLRVLRLLRAQAHHPAAPEAARPSHGRPRAPGSIFSPTYHATHPASLPRRHAPLGRAVRSPARPWTSREATPAKSSPPLGSDLAHRVRRTPQSGAPRCACSRRSRPTSSSSARA